MTIVTGDRYLDLLSTFIEANTSSLLDGSLLLKLNPVGLHYVQTRLEALEELEALRVGAPVDYLRAYVADLGDHRALEQLRRVLRLLSSVKVVSMVPAPSRDPTPITVLPFSRLRSLELRGCDLSTSAARGLLELRPILEKLICYNSADALRHIFSERTKEIQDAPVWSRLADVSCFGNGMLLMDESLQLLPAVEALDLSRNRFAKVANLQKCPKLKFLDAGFNHITTVTSLFKILYGVTKLVLRNNALVSTRGLHRIASLEALDLSYNLISNFLEVELLGELPALRFLWLEGNPLTFSRFYRKEALSYFSDPIKVVLDGKQTSRGESWAARRIVSHRLKQRSKYGAFSPAQTLESCDTSLQLSDSGEFEDAINKAVSNGAGSSAIRARKNSRLASIQDITGIQIACRTVELSREGSFNSLESLDSASAAQSVAERKEQIEETVQDLMQRAEILKRAGSSSWLKDLNILLENEVTNKSQILAQIQRMDSDVNQQSPWQKRRKRRSIRKGSFSESASVSRNSEGSNKSEEQDDSEASLARFTGETSSRRMSKDALKRCGSAYVLNEKYLGAGNLSSTSLDELERSFVDGEEHPDILSDEPNNGDGLKLHDQSGTFRLTAELVTGKMLVGSSSSPPQFNQDLLHRRQTLERELLLLPPEREIAPFYDSESSSGTIYSHLSDSSDSPHHSPSAVWHPFRFDHGQNLEAPSAKADKSDSEDNFQMWSDTEALEGEVSENGEPDGKDLPVVVHTDEGTEPGGKEMTAIFHTAEGKEPGGVGMIRTTHSADGKAPGGKDVTLAIQNEADSEEGTESDGMNIALGVQGGGKEAGGKDATVTSHTEEREGKEAHEAVGGESCSSSSSCQKEHIPPSAGNICPLKDNSGGDDQQLNPCSSLLQPKPKSSRRIVHLESFSGVSESPGWMKPLPRDTNESTHVQRSTSLGVSSAAGLALQRSLSSSVHFSNSINVTRTSSTDANLEKQREWSRSSSQEDSLPSTSLQQGDSHEASDSSLQFHRVHHAVGPFVGQCA